MAKERKRKRRVGQPAARKVAFVGEMKELLKDLEVADELLPRELSGAAPEDDPTVPYRPAPPRFNSEPPYSTVMCPW